MSDENKYITKIIKRENTTNGDGIEESVEVDYLIKDTEARESIEELDNSIREINATLGDFTEQEDFSSVKAEIDRLDNIIGDINSIEHKPENTENNIANNINKLYDGIVNGDSGIYYYLNNTLQPDYNGKITDLNEQLNNAAIALFEDIGGVDNKIGNLSDINNSEGKEQNITGNINRLDTRINDVVDNVSDELSNKISGIIIDSTDIPREPDEEGVVNLNGDITLASINITYDELVRRRNGGALVPGQKYRIIDYVTGVSANIYGFEFISDRHQFDIIVEALTNKTLSENAKACHHEFENPEDDYFINSNLSAWELKYCLDNDHNRFDWVPVDGESVNSCEIYINRNLVGTTSNLLRDDLIPTGYLVIDQYTTDTEEYSTSPVVLVSYGSEFSPCGYGDQLCLHPELPNHDPNPNIAYFYYGDYHPDEANDLMIDGSYWRKAYQDSGVWKWSSISNNGEYLGAIFIITNKNVIDQERSSSLIFSLEKLQQDNTNKGIIYYMKDEWENEAPFDFKNIRIYSDISTKFDGNRSVFNVDNLYSKNQDTGTQVIIKSLRGYWYLFSGLIVEDNGEDWPFLDDLENPALVSSSSDYGERAIVRVNNGSIIDTTMYNNSEISKNTVITAQNTVKPNGDTGTNCCYAMSGNIFLSLYSTSRSSTIPRTMRNIIEFSGAKNIFIAGPNGYTLGNVLSTCCRSNKFYKGVMYKSLPPATTNQTYVQGD